MDYSNLPHGTIVPSQQTPIYPGSSKGSVTKATPPTTPSTPTYPTSFPPTFGDPLPPPPPPVPVPCDLCTICEQGTKLGFVMCGPTGAVFIANDYPATGGPWAPAINPTTGALVWFNTGG